MVWRGEPLTEMLSPRWASSRISAALEMVREVPPPPVVVSSWGISEETAVGLVLVLFRGNWGR